MGPNHFAIAAPPMPPTEEQLRLASSIDARIQTLARQGVTEPFAIVGAMADEMPSFKVSPPRTACSDVASAMASIGAEDLRWRSHAQPNA